MTTSTTEHVPRFFRSSDLKQLAEVSGSPCLSILLPTHQNGPETRQDPIRLKNLLSTASKLLENAGYDCGLLDPLSGLPGDTHFWRHQGNGLAIFLNDDQLTMLRLSRPVEETVHVGNSFCLTPLVREYNMQGECFVLALSWDRVDLYRFDGRELKSVETGQLPANFDDLVQLRDPEEALQNTSHQTPGNAPGGTSTAMFHGQGEGEDKIKADRRHYLSLVASDVDDAIYNTSLPLLLVATSEVAGHFESCSPLDADVVTEVSPSQLTQTQLLERVRHAFESIVGTNDPSFNERFGTALAQGSASDNLSEIVTAAEHGRIAELGFCDDQLATEDLNQVLVNVLRHGGDVFRCDNGSLPGDESVAAVYRY